ncbi:hypothetical protein BJ742DRAFT_808737 [Cladochytrium replicatum]|nr:hypothetical protein BJ742DRAFT_808737 [Cladochytrium replicatum]
MADSGFKQDPPTLNNQYSTNHALRSLLRRMLPKRVMEDVEGDLVRFGGRVIGDVLNWADDVEENPPRLVQYDAWTRRVDELKLSESWRKLHHVAAEEGLIAIGYERKFGEASRIVQYTKLFLFSPSSGMVGCPLAMTDGAARVIEVNGTKQMKQEYLPHLTSRDPKSFWTSGQWMTERPGGSDVSQTETVATSIGGKITTDGEQWYDISGFKFFSSATDSQIALLLARNRDPVTGSVTPGSKGLSLYLAQMRKEDGSLNGIRIHRLKNKFGTKALPTAELELRDMKAVMVGAPGRGVSSITPVLNITRTHAGLTAVAGLWRSISLAKSYALKRKAGSELLSNLPLHARTLADLEVTYRACLHLIFYVVDLIGKDEVGSMIGGDEVWMLRLMTPVAKGFCAKVCTAAITEAMEALGGQGYMEEIGIGRILRDVLVNMIWEGTTNVMALDVMRVINHESKGKALSSLDKVVGSMLPEHASTQTIARAKQNVLNLIPKVRARSTDARGARQLLFDLARIVSAALLVRHAVWSGDPVDGEVALRWSVRDNDNENDSHLVNQDLKMDQAIVFNIPPHAQSKL